MKTTDTSERGLESLIMQSLEADGYTIGSNRDYDRALCIDTIMLFKFLNATQARSLDAIGAAIEGPRRDKFLHRISSEIQKRGVVDVLRKGIKDGPASIDLFYGIPSAQNPKAQALFLTPTSLVLCANYISVMLTSCFPLT